MNKGLSIAIDGPVAAGKGTIAPALARKLNGFYLYTGAMYRCVALFCIENGINLDDESSVDLILSKIIINFEDDKIFLNGKNVTRKIRNEKVAMGASKVGLFSKVREKLVSYQQRIAKDALLKGKTIVAEGRDTGTKVLPNADIKLFLTAKPVIRARRRLLQLKAYGEKVNLKNILKDIKIRDSQDSIRKIDPLVKNPKAYGYFILDNSNLTEEETINVILKKIKQND
jgi:cytidylate kinase